MPTELKTRKRLVIMLVMTSLLFAFIALRIGFLTLVRGEELTARGVRQWTREGVVTAQRGSIVDRNGETLALSATAYIVTANPQTISDPQGFARALSPVLNVPEETIVQKVSKKGLASVILKRQTPRSTVDAVRALKNESDSMAQLLRGVTFDEDVRRWYPKGAFLCQVLGLTNVDSVGQSGLEQKYESVLQGEEGLLKTEVDARARLLPDGKTSYIPPKPGQTLKLTIDSTIQGIVEKAMRECMDVNQAKSVQCIVMDPNTGAILALCMKPDYDPNEPPRSDAQLLQELMRITAVSDVYEPGSTFKILTCAAAIDSGAATVNDLFTCTGSTYVSGDRIRCWKVSHGTQTLKEGLANSCNPVFVSLALRMGTDTMYRYLQSFGLGRKTGVNLPGESAGILISRRVVKDVDLARIGFGQSVALTPVQLISACCACVNGGRLMKPYIVDSILNEDGVPVQSTLPEVVATPISEESSAVMRELLLNVVETGGGKNAKVPGYAVGGKTGTAQVYKDGRVESSVHIGSFIGFAPMDAPEVAVLVTVNEAIVPVDYGSATAAPFAQQILAEVLPYLGVKKTEDGGEQKRVTVPSVVGMDVQEAKRVLAKLGLLTETDGVSTAVSAQAPHSGAELCEGGVVMLYTYDVEPVRAMDMVSVPDVHGLSMVEASRILRARGFEMNIQGSGLAVSQSPGAGEFSAPGDTVTVTFRLP